MGTREEKKKAQVAAGTVLVLVQLAFAGWHVLGKVALNQGVNPLFFALIREIGASLVLLVTAWIFDGKPRTPTMGDYFIFFVLGFLIFINIVGFLLALDLVTPVTAAIYQPLIPVWTALWAVVFKVEPPNAYVLSGIAFAVSGAIVASLADESPTDPAQPPDTLTGNVTLLLGQAGAVVSGARVPSIHKMMGHILLFFQTLSLGTLFLVQKKVVDRYASLTSTAWYYSIGSLMTAITCASYFGTWDNMMKEASYLSNTHIIIAIVYAVFVATAFTYASSTWANKKVHATVVSLYTVLQSPFTIILSAIFLKTMPAFRDIFAMLMITFGMVLVVSSKMNEEEKDEDPEYQSVLADEVPIPEVA